MLFTVFRVRDRATQSSVKNQTQMQKASIVKLAATRVRVSISIMSAFQRNGRRTRRPLRLGLESGFGIDLSARRNGSRNSQGWVPCCVLIDSCSVAMASRLHPLSLNGTPVLPLLDQDESVRYICNLSLKSVGLRLGLGLGLEQF